MNGHISKPIEPAVLFETLAALRRPRGSAPPFALRSAPSSTGVLPVVPGLDTADGLARVAGNQKLYLKLLRQFAEQQAEVPDQIARALAAGDRTTAERLAHTLKGVAGNLGATTVQAAAGALEKEIRGESAASEIEAKLKHTSEMLLPLLTGLKATLAEPAAPTPPAAPVDPAASHAAAGQLAKLLASFDAGAVDLLEAQQAALQPLFDQTRWKAFREHVQAYAFAEALDLLQAVSPGHNP